MEVTKFRVAIQQDIDGGKKVIIVAHSQGNFFAQRALEGISPVDLDAVGVLAIASPTPYPERGLYGFFQRLTLEHDIILTTNPAFPANGVNEISATASRIAIHGFVESYLNQPTSRQRIKQMLQAANAAISNPLALESGSYLRITAKWFEAGDVDLFVGEKDIAADLGAEVYWEFPNGVPQHLFGYLDRSEQVGPGSESYVVCSKANLLRGGCFVIRVYNKGIPAGSQVHVTVRAGTRIWAFIVFVPAPGPDFGSIAWVTDLRCRGDGTITLSNDCDLEVHPPPGGIDETGGK